MENKENKNELLSFEKLREELGIEGELPTLEDIGFSELAEKYSVESESKTVKQPVKEVAKQPVKEIVNEPVKETVHEAVKEPEKVKNDIIKEGKKVVENGTTFIDITAQYTSAAKTTPEEVEQAPVIEKQPEPEIQQVTITPKKRVRTFNEIFSSFFGNFIPLKDDSNKDKIRKILTDVSIVTIVICIFGFGKLFIEYQSTMSGNDKISSKAVIAEKLADNEYVDSWKHYFSQGTTVKFPKRMNPAYAYPYSVNQDLVGWLKMDGLDLDIQVVQGVDNLYYTDKDFYKKKNSSGIPYLESKNNSAELDDNTIIYASNTYFSGLDSYKSLEGYKEAPTFEFGTLYESYTFKVFAAFYVSADTVYDGGFNYKVIDFNSDAKFNSYINEIKLRSFINTDVSVQTADKIVSLVTPSNEFEGAQFVVMGRMVRSNESASVDVDSATLNESPKYPQAWYDSKGMQNPFNK